MDHIRNILCVTGPEVCREENKTSPQGSIQSCNNKESQKSVLVSDMSQLDHMILCDQV